MTTANYSLFAIPTYLVLAMVPHAYSATLLNADEASDKKSDQPKPFETLSGSFYNMNNPRSSKSSEYYAANVSKAKFEKYERARAAHGNMLENSAFVVSAILAGVVTRLPATEMNLLAATYLLTRIGYTISYVNIADLKWSFVRTAWYTAGNMVLFTLYWKAGRKLSQGI